MNRFQYVLQFGVGVAHARVVMQLALHGTRTDEPDSDFAFEIFTVYYNQVLFCCDVFLSTQNTYRYCP